MEESSQGRFTKQQAVGRIQALKEWDQRKSKVVRFLEPSDGGEDLYFDIDDTSDLKDGDIVLFETKIEPFVSQENNRSKRRTYQHKAIRLQRAPEDNPIVLRLRCLSMKPEDYLSRAQFFLPTLAANEQLQWLKARASSLKRLSADAWDTVLDEVISDVIIWKAAPGRCRNRQIEREVQTLASAARDWTETDFDVALATIREISVRREEADRNLSRENGSQIALAAYNEVGRRLVALIQMRGRTKQGDIASLGEVDLDQAFGAIEQIKEAVEILVSAFPRAKAECGQIVIEVEKAAVDRLTQGRVPFVFAWQTRVRALIQKHAEFALTLPDISSSSALTATVLCCPRLARKVPGRVEEPSLVALAAAIRAYAESPPKLEGSTRFDSLTAIDLILAAKYCGNYAIEQLVRNRRLGSIAELEVVLDTSDGRELNTYRVEGLQPRIAELAFAEIFELVAGSGITELEDLNVAAIQIGQVLPADDFRRGEQYFDVKSNRYYRSREGRLGLRGFQLKINHRNPNSVLAAFVFSGSSDWEADWSFVGFARESEVPPGVERAAPFLFSLPAHFDFQLDDANTARLLLRLVQSATPETHPAEHFGAADQSALDISLRSIDRGDLLAERTLWDEATNGLAAMRSAGATIQQGSAYLNQKLREAESKFWLRRLASVNGRPLLSRWISEVLGLLNNSWDQVECPRCNQIGRLRLNPDRITSAGTVTGRLECLCGYVGEGATLITNCWNLRKCGTYPLVIGAHGPHGNGCLGLTCPNCGQCRCTYNGMAGQPYEQ